MPRAFEGRSFYGSRRHSHFDTASVATGMAAQRGVPSVRLRPERHQSGSCPPLTTEADGIRYWHIASTVFASL